MRCGRAGASTARCETGGVSERGTRATGGISVRIDGGSELGRMLSGARSRFCHVPFKNSSTRAQSSSPSLVFWMNPEAPVAKTKLWSSRGERSE